MPSRIFITGDTHGDQDWSKLNTRCFPEQKKLTRDDYVIIAGDFGGVWGLDETDAYIQKNYGQRRFTTLFIDGNHENHDALDAYPVEMWNGGKVHRIADSVIHLMRGQVFEIGGRVIFAMGGAESTDRGYRTEGKSWWPREMPSDEEYDEALRNLAAHDNKVDYIVTHCGPENMLFERDPRFLREPNRLTRFLSQLETVHEVQYREWFFGHYHRDVDIWNLHCLYRRVVELE